MSQPESLQGWFVKQGIKHLWSESVEESEEVLLLLAAEKQWDDIREICSNDLKLPKIKIAYLKAYLIKRTKYLTNVTQVTAPIISADPEDEEDNNEVGASEEEEEEEENQEENPSSGNESQPNQPGPSPPTITLLKKTRKKKSKSNKTKQSVSKKKKRNQRRRRNQKSKRDDDEDEQTPKSSISTTTDRVKSGKSSSRKTRNQTSSTSNDHRHSDRSSKASKVSPVINEEDDDDDEDEESVDPFQALRIQCIEYINSIDVGDQSQRQSTYLQNGFEYNRVPTLNAPSSVMKVKDYSNMIKEGTSQIIRTEDTLKSMDDTESIWNTLMAMDGERALFTVKSSNDTHFREFDMNRNYIFDGRTIPEPYKSEQLTLLQLTTRLMQRTKNQHFLARTTGAVARYLQNVFAKQWSIYLLIAKQCQWGPLMSSIFEIGSKDTVIPLHYELSERVLFQIGGSKEVILFSPECTPFLYPFPYGHPCYRQSMVNMECSSSWTTFTYFKPENDALSKNVYRVVLTEGDMLYIPSGWWIEYCNVDEFNLHLMMESKMGRERKKKMELEMAQVLERKTSAQRVAIGRNVERRVFAKYGKEGGGTLMMEIFKSFVIGDEKYLKHRNDIKRMVNNVFNANEIDPFIQQLVDGRYTIETNQFLNDHNSDHESIVVTDF